MGSSKKILGVIGDPITHSLSPAMQNAALVGAGLSRPAEGAKTASLQFEYRAFHVTPDQLENFIKTAPSQNIVGLNVTIPHKEKIMSYVDELSPEAKQIGAVNTLYWKNGKLFGDNTDARGFILSLEKEASFSLQNKNVVILGAGGAARGIAVACGSSGAKQVTIINRTVEKAEKLIDDMQKIFPKTKYHVGADTWVRPDLCDRIDPIIQGGHMGLPLQLNTTDILINTTSVGLDKKSSPFSDFHLLNKTCLVADIVYNPRKTPFLAEAKKTGLKTLEGWGMLLYQGALSFEIWTGEKAPVDIMKQVLLEKL